MRLDSQVWPKIMNDISCADYARCHPIRLKSHFARLVCRSASKCTTKAKQAEGNKRQIDMPIQTFLFYLV